MNRESLILEAEAIEPAAGVRSALAARLKGSTIFRLDLAALARASRQPEPFTLRIEGDAFELALHRHDLLAPDLEFQASEPDTGDALAEVRTYRGHLVDDPESRVSLVLASDFLQGSITVREETFFLDALTAFAEGADAGLLVLYRASEMRSEAQGAGPVCGIADSRPPEETPSPSSEDEAATTTYYVPIAIEADYEFWNLNQTTWQAKILGVINDVSAVLEQYHGLRLIVTHLAAHVNADEQPYTSTTAETLLEQLRTYGDVITAERALTHLFSGKELDDWVAGVADQGAVCKRATYGLSALPQGTQNGLVGVVAHELGHNFNAGHAANEHCQGSTAVIMCSSFGTNRTFLPPNVAAVETHVSANHGCLWSGPFSRGKALHENAKTRQTPVPIDFHGMEGIDPPAPQFMVLWSAEHGSGGIHFSVRHYGRPWSDHQVVGEGNWRDYTTYLYAAALTDEVRNNGGIQLVWRGFHWNQPEIYGTRGTWSQTNGWSWGKFNEIQPGATPESPALSRIYGIFAGRILVWVEDDEKRRLCYKTSSDKGQTWSSPTRIGDAYASQKTPAVLPSGTTFYVFGNSTSSTREIWYTSWDQASWKTPIDLPGAASDFAPAALELSGGLLVAWKELGSGNRILFSRSAPPYTSWSPPVPINSDQHNAHCGPALVDLGGQIFVFWVDASDWYRIHFARLI